MWNSVLHSWESSGSACLRSKPQGQNKSCHGTGASVSRGFSLVQVARRSQTAQLHITGTRETVPPQDPCQGRGNAATLKRLRKNLIRIPDPNCTSLVSVQQNHFCPHGAVRSAETALHCLCSLFNSFGMFFRWGLSTWKAWGMEGKVTCEKWMVQTAAWWHHGMLLAVPGQQLCQIQPGLGSSREFLSWSPCCCG